MVQAADDLTAMFGLDPHDPAHRLGLDLARADQQLIEDLVAARLAAGLQQKDVAARIRRDPATVSTFEKLGGDPRLSTIRRYARAVGVRVTHHVEVPAIAGYVLDVVLGTTDTEAVPEPTTAGRPRTLHVAA